MTRVDVTLRSDDQTLERKLHGVENLLPAELASIQLYPGQLFQIPVPTPMSQPPRVSFMAKNDHDPGPIVRIRQGITTLAQFIVRPGRPYFVTLPVNATIIEIENVATEQIGVEYAIL